MWFPDWPVTAAGFAPDVPAAVMAANRVIARTPAAADEGVVVGQRRRQAQARCPHVVLVDEDRARDAREFEPVIRAVAELSPRLDVIEPGWITLDARGPSRYFGGEAMFASRLIATIAVATAPNAGVGIADGRFASSIAARLAIRQHEPVLIAAGDSARFCAGLPIGWLQALGEAQPELVDLFARLGLRRLGDLAALSSSDVLGRFGHPGVHAHRLASGADERLSSTTDPAPERRLDHVLDDPIAQTGAVVFVAKQLADELGETLAAQGRVCTRLVVLLETEHGERSERSWYRSAGLTAAAMVERVRWQLDAWVDLPRGSDQEITGGIVLIRLVPEEVRADVGQQLGLWGGQSDADRRAIRAIARLTTLDVGDGGDGAGVARRPTPRRPVPVGAGDHRRSRSVHAHGVARQHRERSERTVARQPADAVTGHRLRRPSSRRGARRAGPGGRSERARCGVGSTGEPDDHARRRVGRLAAWTTAGDHGVGRAVAHRPTLVGAEPPPAPGAVPDAHRRRGRWCA